MQFHHHGYVTHDPRIKEPAGTGIDRPAELPDAMDVLIVGAGPAGIIQAAQLTNYPSVTTRIIESRPHRLEVGRADGLWPRSSETFQAFEFRGRIAEEAMHLREMNFWGPHPANPAVIARGVRAADPPPHISEFPPIVVNQARVIDYFAEYAANGPAKIDPDYGYEFVDYSRDESDEFPVQVRLRGPDGQERQVRTKYLVGCDGARSLVRDSAEIEVMADPAAHAWAVMDILAVTDFPDFRTKCGIQSDKDGTVLLIPREGGFLVRFYVSLGDVDDANRAQVRATTVEEAIERAKRILNPYSLEVRDVAWYSVYEVRHRIAKRFDDARTAPASDPGPRVFIAGDACHTHSAKAGQGMNVSMQDGWNLAWKLGQVLEGRSAPSLLTTYAAERLVIAEDLIAFDKEWSAMMSKRPEEFSSPQEIGDYYVDSAEFPNGFSTEYQPSILTGEPTYQELAAGFPIGKRFKSAEVSRVADTTLRHLGHHFRADGRWRLYAFADADGTEVADLANWLEHSPESPVAKFTPEGADIDGVFDAKVIYQQPYQEIDLGQVSRYFLPQVGPFRLTDYEKVYSALPHSDIFDVRQIDRQSGALVIVRPDMYVAHVLPLTAREEITEFFANNMLVQQASESIVVDA